MKNPAFEQPFKSARTNSRSLLFRSRRRGRPYRRGSLSGLDSYSIGRAKLARGPEDFINVLHAVGVPTPFCLAGHVTKGAHDRRNPQATAWAAWEAKERSTRC